MDKKKLKIYNFISNFKIIPLITCKDLDVAKNLCKCIINSGCKIIEFGIRHENSLDNYQKLKKFIDLEFDDVIFGAGSVSELEIAKKILDVGADFIISPGYNNLVNIECKSKNKLYIPGCSTPTECINAKVSGVELVKLFPANHLGGIDFFRSLKSALPWLEIIPAGGILPNSVYVNQWLKAGATAVTLGSNLFRKDLIKEGNYLQIEKNLSDIILNRELQI